MTLAVAVKVNEGIVIAADSASTMINNGNQIVNVYDNANKIFNLYKGLPIGAATWNLGSIGQASISMLSKEFRSRISAVGSPDAIDPNNYTIAEVAQRFRDFIFDEKYNVHFADPNNKPSLGLWLCGYSANTAMPELYGIDINTGVCAAPQEIVPPNETVMAWNGQPEAVLRLIMGHGSQLSVILEHQLGVPAADVPVAINQIEAGLMTTLAYDLMPIQDAIDLAIFLVDTTIKYVRFLPGAQTVGGPIEVAAITRYEGFKWIKRKHYYKAEIN